MHWTQTQPGSLDTERELQLIEQTPAEVVFLSAADTDLAMAAQAWTSRFGSRLRLAHAGALRQPVSADHYVEKVIRHSRLVIARLLGGETYYRHFIQGLADLKEEDSRPRLLILPVTDAADEDLLALNDFPIEISRRLARFFQEGGPENMRRAGESIDLLLRNNAHALPEPVSMPEFGVHRVSEKTGQHCAWICFYRAWYQAGDLAVIDALFAALEEKGFAVHSFYSFSLRQPAAQRELLRLASASPPDVILTMQSFSLELGSENQLSFLEQLGCPVLQVPVALGEEKDWRVSRSGLSPAEIAMNVALPEIDGRVFGTVVGFKEKETALTELECEIKRLKPEAGQIAHIAEWAQNWAGLRKKPNAEKKIAVILSNYPNRDGRIGNGVGLDTPASTVNFLRALQRENYVVGQLPENGEELMRWLQESVTNDPEHSWGKPCRQYLEAEVFQRYAEQWPDAIRDESVKEWGLSFDQPLPISGIQMGNIFIGIQPPRGFSQQAQAIYHSPTLPPPPAYLAFYFWIREVFNADAIVHLGKHGNLEWLPGRSVALAGDDYPQLCLGALPHLYPFIVNNPGEGAQAKRRTSAVIVDHLTPPIKRAGLYDDLERMERLLEEHAHAAALYPARTAELEREIEQVLATASWSKELPGKDRSLDVLGNFLCEIKESQIRSGLHILGENPVGELEIDFLLSLLRVPAGNRPGLLEALAQNADIDSLSAPERDALEIRARAWITHALDHDVTLDKNDDLQKLRGLLCQQIRPRLARCEDELQNLINGLSGKFVPPGPAGAPTRGRLDVLPTGRNFFSLDPRVIPTPTAWRCGKAMAETLIERHRQETGEYPRKLALVIWGTSNMRTGGDDIAQALWLWGCEPVWEEASGRVVDFRILPASLLGRPRVDVLLRVSGLFRDAFGETMRLLATVPKRLAEQDEPPESNPVRESWLRDRAAFVSKGINEIEAGRLAGLRVFSSEPGAYGAGLLPLIDAGNWKSKRDLAEVFCRWGGHAFDSTGSGTEQGELLRTRLSEIEVVHQNQDNREHDILDSDDYFQFQGGLRATIEELRGVAPATYHGDSSQPEHPRVRTLEEELIRVIRSRVLNPRWIEAMRNHGYKGAFEMAATVDYLFGYDATTGLIQDHHYEEISRKLLLAPEQQQFFKRHNPAALQEACERMMEAAERGLWVHPGQETLSALEETLLELHGDME